MASPFPDPADDLPALQHDAVDEPAVPGLSMAGAIVAVCALAWLIHFSLSELNPDWGAYQAMYDSGGAWLAEAGRDPAFIAFVAFSYSVLGGDGYEAWRTWLAAWFVLFSFVMACGRVIPSSGMLAGRPVELSLWAIAIGLTYLGCTRFTIQVREGLAISIALIGLGLLIRHHQAWVQESTPPPDAEEAGASALGSGLGWAFLAVASLMHLATASLLVVALAARWVAAADPGEANLDGQAAADPSSSDQQGMADRISALWALAIAGLLIAVLELGTGGLLETVALDTAGDRLAVQREVTLEVVGLWALYGVVCFLLQRESRAQAAALGRTLAAAFLRVLAGPALMGVYALVIACLALDVSTLVMTNFIRLLHLLLAVLLVMLALSGARAWLVCLAGAFLIADQVRSIVQSISLTFGVDLL